MVIISRIERKNSTKRYDVPKEITSAVREFIEQWKKLKDGSYSEELEASKRKAIEQILKIEKIRENYNYRDIYDALFHICLYTNKNLSEIEDKDIELYMSRLFEDSKPRFAFTPINCLNFPDGYEIGEISILSYEKSPKWFKRKIYEDTKLEYKYGEKKNKARTLKQFLNENISKEWLKTEISSRGMHKILDDAEVKFKHNINILRVSVRRPVETIFSPIYIFDEKCRFLCSSGKSNGYPLFYPKYIDERVKLLNKVYSERKNEIQKRIIDSLDIYGIATNVDRIELKFTLLCFAIEKLLLAGDDEKNLRLRFSEKVTFLIESELEKRKNLFKLMGEMYDKRSYFAHHKREKERKDEEITQNDLDSIEGIFIIILNRIIQLENEGKNSMNDIDELINNLKFG